MEKRKANHSLLCEAVDGISFVIMQTLNIDVTKMSNNPHGGGWQGVWFGRKGIVNTWSWKIKTQQAKLFI